MASTSPVRRRALTLAAVLALIGIPVGPHAPTPAAATGSTLSIDSGTLTAQVDAAFPRVLGYTDDASGKVLYGQEDALSTVLLNGASYTPTVTSTASGAEVDYVLTFPSAAGVEIDAKLAVGGSVLEFAVTKISDTSALRINTLELPGQNLVSVRSTQPGAGVATAVVDADASHTGDTITAVTSTTPADPAPVRSAYGFVYGGGLAAAISTNSVYDQPSGATGNDNGRVARQAVAKSGYVREGLWSGQFTYRPAGSSTTQPLPDVRIAIAGDRNGDGTVDWQDGAIALRDVLPAPAGSAATPLRVIPHIPFNFASQANHPFLRTLDNIKRISLNTDGLHQFALLKGYASEGHDSGHPDYGAVGTGQGGVADLNTLVNSAAAYGADIGVHINETEAYPAAKTFDPAILNSPLSKGWDWLNQSWTINDRADENSGALTARLKTLHDEVPGLKVVYADAYYGDGQVAQTFADTVHSYGWQLATEFPNELEGQSIWSHWANDVNYGPNTSRGIDSSIIRFVRNQQADVWLTDPLLMGAHVSEFEGWQGKQDYNAFLANVFNENLPTKYMQNFPIMKETSSEVDFGSGVKVSNATGTRQISKDGRLVLNGGSYLIPWDPSGESKLYHWNASGGSTTWTLPPSWSASNSVKLYRLTDTGRQFVADLPVGSGQITVNATAGTPYVVYPTAPQTQTAPGYGEGGPVKDPSFLSRSLASWSPTGDTNTASVALSSNGKPYLSIANGNAVNVSQQLTGLTPGSYSASVWTQVASGQRRATLDVQPSGGTEASVWADSSTLTDTVSGDDLHGTTFQRMNVYFTVPTGQSTAMLNLQTAAGTATVNFTDVRVVAGTPPPTNGHTYYQDFEHTDQGWGPFVKGDAGGVTDPRTSLAQLHTPYTQKGWNGQQIDDVLDGSQSLKAHEENAGLVYRTIPQTVRFLPGHSYKVSFSYEADVRGDYSVVLGRDQAGSASTTVSTTPISAANTPTTYSTTFSTAGCGDYWIGVSKISTPAGQHDLVVDDFAVDDLGPATSASAGAAIGCHLDRTGWSVKYADSQETVGENGVATNVLDGKSSTIWHTQWYNGVAPLPHEIQLDLGRSYALNSLYYLPRQDGNTNGMVGTYEVYVSNDGTTWGTPVATGTFKKTTSEEVATFPTTIGRYVRFRALSEVNGQQFTSAAELNLGGSAVLAPRISQAGWSLKYVDSQETVGENGVATNAFDGNPGTTWDSQWDGTVASLPHEIQIDMGASHTLSTLYYLPRQDGNTNGDVSQFELYVSADGTTWGSPVATGTFAKSANEQAVSFPAVTGRYLRFRALSEVNGQQFTTVAELNVG